MGHHIVNGRFRSDRHPALADDKVVVSFKHFRSHAALRALATAYQDVDPEFSDDILTRLKTIKE